MVSINWNFPILILNKDIVDSINKFIEEIKKQYKVIAIYLYL